MVSRSALLSLLVAFTTHVAAANFFPYEKEHLTAENIEEVLNDRLPKQSRILGGAEVAEFLSTFFFSSVDVTSDHNTKVDLTCRDPRAARSFRVMSLGLQNGFGAASSWPRWVVLSSQFLSPVFATPMARARLMRLRVSLLQRTGIRRSSCTYRLLDSGIITR